MNPGGEQEMGDCQEDGAISHPDFSHLNPDDLHIPENQVRVEKQFRQIKIDNIVFIQKTRNSDVYRYAQVKKL